jgi:hypothetical protein
VLALVAGVTDAGDIPAAARGVGANKYDLLRQYLGRASGGDGSAKYRKVTEAMARKALDDAGDYGIPFVRISASGFAPSKVGETGDLDLWQRAPKEYWSRVDRMMDDLDARSLYLVPVLMWNVFQFPAMSKERVSDLVKNERSASWRLLAAYVTEFVTRYRGRRTILFYELTNELNLMADLDTEGRCNRGKGGGNCEVRGNFSTEDMIAFTQRLARTVRVLDGTRAISSGFAVPRRAAEHLRRRPEWTSAAGAWEPDTEAEFVRYLLDAHAGLDIVSVHIYDTEENRRFGSKDAADLVSVVKRAADKGSKTLFVGEFGDDARKGKEGSYSNRVLKRIAELKVPFSAVWVLEFYQTSPYESWNSEPTLFSVEPGQTDFLLRAIATTNQHFGRPIAKEQDGIDRKAPRVVLTWPLDCALLKDKQKAHAVASDNKDSLVKVEFWLGNRLLVVDGEPPYETPLSVRGMDAGEHTLTARAIDAAGNRAEWSAWVFVGNAKASAACAAEINKN